MRLSQARRDYYRRRAKKEGYLSRAAYKLLYINQKYRLIKAGYTLVDFGCAPGGWMQVASTIVGDRGFVLGVDLKPVKLRLANSLAIVADVMNPKVEKMILEKIPMKADVILSDLAPNISGVWELDHERQIELTDKVVSMMPSILKHGGSAVLKLFQGEKLNGFINNLRRVFDRVEIVKPPASRSESSEVYVVCFQFNSGRRS